MSQGEGLARCTDTWVWSTGVAGHRVGFGEAENKEGMWARKESGSRHGGGGANCLQTSGLGAHRRH